MNLDEYELTEEDAERFNARSNRTHSNLKAGEKFPMLTTRVTPVYKHNEDEGTKKKIGELHHVTVFFPDGPEVLQISRENPKEETPKEPTKENDE